MTLLEALKKRQSVMVIIKYQDPRLETAETALYRVKYLEMLNNVIANLIKSTGHDSIYINEAGETSGRETGLDRERNTERGGNRQRTMGIDGRQKKSFTEQCKLCWRQVKAEIYKITLTKKGSYLVH
jgi:hypothetical protein